MVDPTADQARDRARRAREALQALTGHLADIPAGMESKGLTCGDMYMVSAIAASYAAQAELMGAGDKLVGYYSGLSDAYWAAAEAC